MKRAVKSKPCLNLRLKTIYKTLSACIIARKKEEITLEILYIINCSIWGADFWKLQENLSSRHMSALVVWV